MKKCSKCKEHKALDCFNKKGLSTNGVQKLQPYCRDCQRLVSREQYKNSSEKQKEQIYLAKNIRVSKNKKIIKDIKESTPCMDCGKKYPHYVMDFDHQHSKEFIVSKAVNDGTSLNKILNEISKCELVCANCHRVRTFATSGDSLIG